MFGEEWFSRVERSGVRGERERDDREERRERVIVWRGVEERTERVIRGEKKE